MERNTDIEGLASKIMKDEIEHPVLKALITKSHATQQQIQEAGKEINATEKKLEAQKAAAQTLVGRAQEQSDLIVQFGTEYLENAALAPKVVEIVDSKSDIKLASEVAAEGKENAKDVKKR